MDESSARSFLNSLWSDKHIEESTCCQCGQRINAKDVLARTFALENQNPTNSSARQCAEKLEVPIMAKVILVYHRHLKCLIATTPYVAITHVWDAQVAELQDRRAKATCSVVEVAKTVLEAPTRICLGLAASLTENFEIWHDYISVPQWQPTLKGQIIQSIPQIFNQAKFIVVYLSDLDAKSVEMMRKGTSVYERCRGISNVCNVKWFSRMWTAMELTQSRELRIMLKDYTLVENRDSSCPFIYELEPAWDNEVKKQGPGYKLEKMVGMGNNLVPWQLCNFMNVRDQSLRGNRIMFAEAHEFLARRCVTIPRDFFHALLGILKIDLTYPQLSTDSQQAMQQIAKQCMQKGDYSPLFMIPASVQVEPDEATIRRSGYLDLYTFALGPEYERATFGIRFQSGNPIFKAEVVGVVQQIRLMDSIKDMDSVIEDSRSLWKTFAILCKLTLDFTGPNAVDAFVITIGTRLYGQSHEKIFNLLSEGDRLCQLQKKLSTLYSSSLDDSEDITDWIADALGLSDFSLTPQMNVTPMQFLNGHGESLHLRNASAIVIVNCSRCEKNFLIRMALLKPPSSLLGVKAYRIPGLDYSFTRIGGAGFLLQDRNIVGRFIWGAPTCDCLKTEEIEVHLNDLTLPRSNMCEYGLQAEAEWLPLSLGPAIRPF